MFTALLFMLKSHAQVPVPDCAVLTAALSKKYEGECKKGQASGKGEAWGDSHHYTGEFKKGMPNGKGTYHFNADSLYTGNVQDGLREGKGEMTYKKSKNGVVQGYWSGDIYRGKSYRTFAMSGGSNFLLMIYRLRHHRAICSRLKLLLPPEILHGVRAFMYPAFRHNTPVIKTSARSYPHTTLRTLRLQTYK